MDFKILLRIIPKEVLDKDMDNMLYSNRKRKRDSVKPCKTR